MRGGANDGNGWGVLSMRGVNSDIDSSFSLFIEHLILHCQFQLVHSSHQLTQGEMTVIHMHSSAKNPLPTMWHTPKAH